MSLQRLLLSLILVSVFSGKALAAEIIIVRPKSIEDVLVNPGIGFMTFQRFNGDKLNEGSRWTEGFPIEYQSFDGDLENEGYPSTSLAYFRVNWRFLEPAQGEYNWGLIDRALSVAAERGQTLLLRISPYEGDLAKDVPDWYRDLIGVERELPVDKWRVDPENPLYLKHFGGLIREIGARYDGHPYLESVDIAIVGYWGEGEGSHLLDDETRKALLNAYLDSFRKTPLIFQPLNGDAPDPGVLVKGLPIAASWPNGKNNGTGPEMRYLGWRLDCLGDMGFWREQRGNWSHMLDVYPQDIVKSGMSKAWEKAPVTLEICGTFSRWQETEGYDEKTVNYIFDQALKWHISSFNAKSSPVPPEWEPLVNEWLKKMGYRFELRKLTYPSEVTPNGQLQITSWWENKGVAPCYKDYNLALRLNGVKGSPVLPLDCDIREWLPGDALCDAAAYLPTNVVEGEYQLEIGILDDENRPVVRLAIEGRQADGWYSLGSIRVTDSLGSAVN